MAFPAAAQLYLPGFTCDGKGNVSVQETACDVDAMVFGTLKPYILKETLDSADVSPNSLYEGFEGVVEWPGEPSLLPGAGLAMQPFWFTLFQPDQALKVSQWDTLRWSTHSYSCRGDMWISQYYTALWYGASGIPDSMVHGRSYYVESTEHFKPEYSASWTVNAQRQLVRFKNYYLQSWDDTTLIPYCEWTLHWQYDKKGRMVRRIRSIENAKFRMDADSMRARLRPYGKDSEALDWYALQAWMRDTLQGGGILEWFELRYKSDLLVEALHYDESWAQVCMAEYAYSPSGQLTGIQRYGGNPFRLYYNRKGRLEHVETDLRFMESDAGPYTECLFPKYSAASVLEGFRKQLPENP
jgi:hypothetical protein